MKCLSTHCQCKTSGLSMNITSYPDQPMLLLIHMNMLHWDPMKQRYNHHILCSIVIQAQYNTLQFHHGYLFFLSLPTLKTIIIPLWMKQQYHMQDF